MFDNYKEFFAGLAPLREDQPGAPTARDLLVSVVVLLAATAHADTDFETAEMNSIVGQMFSEFGLKDYESGEILELAEYLVKDGSKIDQYLQNVVAKFDADQRQIVLAMVWRVILADGLAERFETELAVELRTKLMLSLEQGVRARKLAELNQVNLELARLTKTN